MKSHLVTVSGGLTSRAVTDLQGRYLGAVNELRDGRFEALIIGEAHDNEPTFETRDDAEDYLFQTAQKTTTQ